MSETFSVTATERGVIRLFMVNLTADQAAEFTMDGAENQPSRVAQALGLIHLNTEFVELFPLSNLDGLGLAGYLTEGLGVAEEDVKPQASRLNSMSGYILIVLSQAFGGVSVTLKPTAPLKWIGTYTEEGASVKFEPLPSDSATGVVEAPKGKAPKSDARVGGMIAMYALIAMFALVGLIIWVGG